MKNKKPNKAAIKYREIVERGERLISETEEKLEILKQELNLNRRILEIVEVNPDIKWGELVDQLQKEDEENDGYK